MLQAQSFLLTFKSSESLLVERSVQEGLLVLSQEYQLEDTLTHKRYSLDNQRYFGKISSFAVLTDTGIITSSRVLWPWETDENFIQYKNSKYQPIVSKTSAMYVSDTTWRETFLLVPSGASPLSDPTWCFVQSSAYDHGFICDTLRNEDEGWIVWMIANVANDREVFSLETLRYKYTEESNDKAIHALSGNVVGGVFITPTYECVGQIVLKLKGILTLFENGWRIGAIVTENELSIENTSVSILTPFENGDESIPE